MDTVVYLTKPKIPTKRLAETNYVAHTQYSTLVVWGNDMLQKYWTTLDRPIHTRKWNNKRLLITPRIVSLNGLALNSECPD